MSDSPTAHDSLPKIGNALKVYLPSSCKSDLHPKLLRSLPEVMQAAMDNDIFRLKLQTQPFGGYESNVRETSRLKHDFGITGSRQQTANAKETSKLVGYSLL